MVVCQIFGLFQGTGDRGNDGDLRQTRQTGGAYSLELLEEAVFQGPDTIHLFFRLILASWEGFRVLKQLSCESGLCYVRTSALHYFALVSRGRGKQVIPLQGCSEGWKRRSPPTPAWSLT